jgi:hypothetical protein
VHVAGPRLESPEGLRDNHHELLEEDYEILDFVLSRTSPRIVTLEYGGTGPKLETPERNDPEALERQLTRLTRVLRGTDGA